MKLSHMLAGSTVFFTSHVLPAQSAVLSIPSGTRVRVSGPAVGGTGMRVTRFVRAQGDTIFLRGADDADTDVTAMPTSGLTRLEMSTGTTRHTWRGGWIGAVAGGVVGVLTAGDGSAILPGAAETGNASTARGVDRTASMLSGALIGAVGGAVAGHFWKSDHWVRLPLDER